MSAPLPPECLVLDKDVGRWSADIVFHGPPGAERRVTGTAEGRLVGHGRWLVTDFATEGGDFEGHSVMGFDPARRAYVYTWVDSLRPFLAVGEGHWDAERRVMTIDTEADYDGRRLQWREETRSVDADTREFRSFMRGPDGAYHPTMTATYRRARQVP